MAYEVKGFQLQEVPPVYVAKIPGRWLLSHVTPSWRIEDPVEGFQRIVNEKRATQIARTVLDQERTFPNAIVLATDAKKVIVNGDAIAFPQSIRFLVVDGQHRLWAQNFSEFEAAYACLIHLALSEEEMARLFLEINENQKRVPSSLRWDLTRLIRDEGDPTASRASDLIFELSTNELSPLYQRIDRTGEIGELKIKQGSLAPEIQSLIKKKGPLHELGFDIQFQLLVAFFVALRDCDPQGWDTGSSNFYTNRVLRAVLRTIHGILDRESTEPRMADSNVFYKYLSRLNPETLSPERIVAQQGSAGITAIYKAIEAKIFS